MSLNLKPSASTLLRISAGDDSRLLLMRMSPCGVTTRYDGQILAAHVIEIARDVKRRKRPRPRRDWSAAELQAQSAKRPEATERYERLQIRRSFEFTLLRCERVVVLAQSQLRAPDERRASPSPAPHRPAADSAPASGRQPRHRAERATPLHQRRRPRPGVRRCPARRQPCRVRHPRRRCRRRRAAPAPCSPSSSISPATRMRRVPGRAASVRIMERSASGFEL